MDLVICYCTIVSPTATTPAVSARLDRLTLAWLVAPIEIAFILLSADFPQLEALHILSRCKSQRPQDVGQLSRALVRYTAQLKELTLSFFEAERRFELPEAVWSSFETLHTLAMDHDASFDTILPHLSSPLAYLYLRPPSSSTYDDTFVHKLLDSLSTSSDLLSSIKRIRPPRTSLQEADQDQRARDSLAGLCAARGIEMVEIALLELVLYREARGGARHLVSAR